MVNFPSTIRTSDWKLFKQKRRKAQVKTKFESGVVQSRAKETSARWSFEIGWEWLTESEYDDLVDFFDENQGDTFNFTHPINNAVFIVRFSDDELPEAVPIGTGHWQVTGLKLEEA